MLPNHLQIRRSVRSKRLHLLVKPGLIELVVPTALPEAQAMAFLNKHRAWAENKLLEINARVAQTSSGFVSGSTIPWRGRELPLLIREEPGRRVRVAVDEAVRITLPEDLGESRDEVAKRALYAWVKPWLRGQVERLAERHTPRFGLYPREVRIKQMKTRWGSCGPHNDININWLLAFTPESVLEYVVVHELCHIRERNHSPAFWALLARHLPQYLEERNWLRSQGAALIRRFSL
ncbi:MAG: SprT family zinc-dependent metalloprotease [Methylococcaceae bacterium]|nr:SprT family zinc-dependent metalloprotease [Methylococcaceae bacterium]